MYSMVVQYLKRDRELEVGYMRLEDMLRQREAQGAEQGFSQGMAKSIEIFLSKFGEVPEELQTCIENETDLEVLQQWVKLASESESIEDFKAHM